jgi:hypothetical protein
MNPEHAANGTLMRLRRHHCVWLAPRSGTCHPSGLQTVRTEEFGGFFTLLPDRGAFVATVFERMNIELPFCRHCGLELACGSLGVRQQCKCASPRDARTRPVQMTAGA